VNVTTPGATVISLPSDAAWWTTGNIATNTTVEWYQFAPAAAGSYSIQWDDASPYTGNVSVSAYRSNGATIFINQSVNNPQSLAVDGSETIYVKVESYAGQYVGTYGIRYYDPATVPPVEAPLYPSVAATPGGAIITWNYTMEDATGYKVYRSSTSAWPSGQSDLDALVIGTINTPTGLLWVDNDSLSAGATYYYKVGAVNTNGGGPLSVAVSAAALSPSTPVTPLTLGSWVSGTLVNGTDVFWYQFTESPGAYRVQGDDTYGSGGYNAKCSLWIYVINGNSGSIALDSQAMSYTTPRPVDIVSGDTVYVKVAASFSSNANIGSYAVRYYDPATSPPVAAPTISNPSPTIPSSVAIPGGCSIMWGWNTNSGPTPDSYKIYRSNSATWDPSPVPIATVTGIIYFDSAVSAGTQYWYKVSAANTSGEGPSSTAITLTATTQLAASIPVLTLKSGEDDWTNGSFAASTDEAWYQFTPTSSGVYLLQWDDGYHTTTDTSLARSYVSAYKAANGSTALARTVNGYTTPKSITVTLGETVYVKVVPTSASYLGNYAIRYYPQ
jgi:hypothetical protein